MYRPGVDAVVVSYRTPHDLRRFVESWIAHRPEYLDTTLRIVNVAPTPEDTAVAMEFWEPGRIGVDEYVDNIGYGRACNLGSQGGSHDVLALFNADIELTPGAVEACYEALMSNDEWGVLGPRQINDDGRLVHAGIVGPGSSPRHRGWLVQDKGQYDDVLDDVPTVSGSAYFVKRAVWDELRSCEIHRTVADDDGAFLPTPHYYDETWCSYHARAHGWRCVYFGAVTVYHQWHRASPLGGWAEKVQPQSREAFRQACDLHGVERD